MSNSALGADRRLVLLLAGAVLLIIIIVSLIAPASATNDPRPSSYNTAPGGAKAAYLTLESLHVPVARWDQPLGNLSTADAAQTTLILAEPLYSALEKDQLARDLQAFLKSGGRVLTTGSGGALLLPGGMTAGSSRLTPLCYTEPEGPGALARAGHVEMQESVRWAGESPAVRVEQRCGPDAVVTDLPVGRGEAIWWSSASPLSNAELHNDADLQLLLASVGAGRRVLFDETLQQPVRSKWSATQGLPLWSLLAQAALVFALLVFSFSRRRGPIRMPVTVPRSSPLEFAESMGDLYERAGATGAAVNAAKRRLIRTLVREADLPQRTAESEPAAIAEALQSRFGSDWSLTREHLQAVSEAAEAPLRPRSALALVRDLGEDARRVKAAVLPGTPEPAAEPASADLTATIH